ncbi:DUF5606 domain-containing protein [Olivibacter sitiensis]|uniref:DUF5606 family protein n=1 Tax=Olivibacter sitiensis TaxID=376470 RepID=UPI000408DC62|nr:DUF5606 domain-containing protein [Olivibacter sitiensis]
MNLRGIVSVTGKPGLFKLIGQNKTGFILESLDDKKTKTIVNIATARMASLEDITIFGEHEDIKLADIFEKMKKHGEVVNAKEGSDKLRKYFLEIEPDHDAERVYISDIKKLINWYNIIKEYPFFDEDAPAVENPESGESN